MVVMGSFSPGLATHINSHNNVRPNGIMLAPEGKFVLYNKRKIMNSMFLTKIATNACGQQEVKSNHGLYNYNI
jgi:hypothetical protein